MTRFSSLLRLTVMAAAVLCLWAPNTRAQFMKREITLSAAGGFQYATGDFAALVKRGSGLRGDIGYYASPSWQLNLGAAYQKYDSETIARARSGLTGVRYTSLEATANLYLYPESWFTPYTGGGFGLYRGRQWYTNNGTESTLDRTRFGLIGGFGLSAHKEGSRLSVFSEIMYHHIMTDKGASDQTVRWHTGLRISFGGRPF